MTSRAPHVKSTRNIRGIRTHIETQPAHAIGHSAGLGDSQWSFRQGAYLYPLLSVPEATNHGTASERVFQFRKYQDSARKGSHSFPLNKALLYLVSTKLRILSKTITGRRSVDTSRQSEMCCLERATFPVPRLAHVRYAQHVVS